MDIGPVRDLPPNGNTRSFASLAMFIQKGN